MSEYIERSALLRTLSKEVGYNDDGDQEINSDTVFIAIESAPAADVAPVVRCRKCKYWQDNNGGYPNDECRWGHGETPDEDDYCSFGVPLD